MSNILITINKSDPKRKHCTDKLGFPFNFLKQGPDASFLIKQDDLNSRLCILSDKPLELISEEQIMKAFLKDE